MRSVSEGRMFASRRPRRDQAWKLEAQFVTACRLAHLSKLQTSLKTLSKQLPDKTEPTATENVSFFSHIYCVFISLKQPASCDRLLSHLRFWIQKAQCRFLIGQCSVFPTLWKHRLNRAFLTRMGSGYQAGTRRITGRTEADCIKDLLASVMHCISLFVSMRS